MEAEELFEVAAVAPVEPAVAEVYVGDGVQFVVAGPLVVEEKELFAEDEALLEEAGTRFVKVAPLSVHLEVLSVKVLVQLWGALTAEW